MTVSLQKLRGKTLAFLYPYILKYNSFLFSKLNCIFPLKIHKQTSFLGNIFFPPREVDHSQKRKFLLNAVECRISEAMMGQILLVCFETFFSVRFVQPFDIIFVICKVHTREQRQKRARPPECE